MQHPLAHCKVGAPVNSRVVLRYFGGIYWLTLKSQPLTFAFRPGGRADFKDAHTTVYAK